MLQVKYGSGVGEIVGSGVGVSVAVGSGVVVGWGVAVRVGMAVGISAEGAQAANVNTTTLVINKNSLILISCKVLLI